MLEKPSKFRAAAIAGASMGVVSALPGLSLINCCCCAGIIGGGVLAFYLYKQEHREGMPALEATDGLVLGIISGLVGAFTATVLSLFILLVFGPWEAELMRTVMERVLESMESSGNLPPGMADEMRNEMEKNFAESSTAIGILTGLIMNLILFPIFGLLGGLLGYAIFKPKQSAPAAPGMQSAPKL